MDEHVGIIARAISWAEQQKALLGKVTYFALFLAYLICIPGWDLISSSLGIPKELGPSLLIGVFIAQLGLIVALLVDVHAAHYSRDVWYQSHQESLGHIREVLDHAIREKPCELTWIGVSMQSAWLALEQVIRAIESGKGTNVTIRLLQSSPEYLRSDECDLEFMARITESQQEYMARRCEQLETQLKATNSRIEIYQYNYMPNIHGLLVGKHTVFYSSVRWEGAQHEQMSVPAEPMEVLTGQTSRGRYAIELYESWLNRGIVDAKKSGLVWKYPQALSSDSSLQNTAKESQASTREGSQE